MKAASEFATIYLYRGDVDFRKWIRGLVAMIQHEFGKDPGAPALFVFVARDRKRIKAVYWDKTGFSLWLKVLERDRFIMPKAGARLDEIHAEELSKFLDGINIFVQKPHEALQYESYA